MSKAQAPDITLQFNQAEIIESTKKWDQWAGLSNNILNWSKSESVALLLRLLNVLLLNSGLKKIGLIMPPFI